MVGKRTLISLIMAFALAVTLASLPAFAVEEGDSAGDGLNAQALGRGDLSAIEFVYIESPAAASGSAQNIVIGFADGGFVAEGSQLDIVGPYGNVITLPQAAAVDGAVLFTADTSALDYGRYDIAELRYVSANGAPVSVSFAQDDVVDYAFEVGEPYASGEGVSTKGYTVDDSDELIEVDDIASGMAAAGVDPANGPESEGSTSGDELSAQAHDGFVIVLDPGHGGEDGGAGGYGLSEKDVNLRIALYCRDKLQQIPGVTVYMTRYDDSTVGLQDRVDFAVNHNADLVVSLHNNAGGGSGSEVIVPNSSTWYYDETFRTGNELGTVILNKLTALGLGVHQGVYSRDYPQNDDATSEWYYGDGSTADYYKLVRGPRQKGVLGIIVEHAFIDSEGDAAFLASDENLKNLGEADAQAILDYYDSSEGISRLYWGIYDKAYYLAHNQDVQDAFGGSALRSFGHFRMYGMDEGRRGNVLFDVSYYKENNADLASAYGNDLPKYYDHFLNFGIKEGRQGSADFSPAYYRYANADLLAAFGTDWPQYYKHYVTFGINEGRAGTGVIPTGGVLYRLFQPANGEHHYTLNPEERDICTSQWGWVYEGTAWTCPDSSSTPVYRLFHPVTGLHHYTTSEAEREKCVNDWGWTYEGIAWYSDDAQGVTVYRLFHPVTGLHHYTISEEERGICIDQWGWVNEDVAWYGLAA